MIRACMLAALACALGCSPAAPSNPPQLWIAANGSELLIKLQPIEPNPF
jgi:hypothetical protein